MIPLNGMGKLKILSLGRNQIKKVSRITILFDSRQVAYLFVVDLLVTISVHFSIF